MLHVPKRDLSCHTENLDSCYYAKVTQQCQETSFLRQELYCQSKNNRSISHQLSGGSSSYLLVLLVREEAFFSLRRILKKGAQLQYFFFAMYNVRSVPQRRNINWRDYSTSQIYYYCLMEGYIRFPSERHQIYSTLFCREGKNTTPKNNRNYDPLMMLYQPKHTRKNVYRYRSTTRKKYISSCNICLPVAT